MKSKDYSTRLTAWQLDQQTAASNLGGAALARYKLDQKNQLASLAQQAAEDLTGEYKTLFTSFETAQQAAQAAHKSWADGWDYQRLNYAQQTVRASIDRLNTSDELLKAYASEKQKGDEYAARAWAEIGAADIERKSIDINEKARVLNVLRADLEKMQNTPEVIEANAQLEKVTETAYTYKENLRDIATAFNQFGQIGAAIRVEDLSSRLAIKAEYIGEGKYTNHLTMQPIEG